METAPDASPAENGTVSFALRRYGEASEQESSLPGWEQRYSQLSPGRFEGSVACLRFPGVWVLRERMKLAVEQLFTAPEDQIVYFGVPGSAGAFEEDGQVFSSRTFGVGSGWSRLSVSQDDSDVIMAMVDRDVFDEASLPPLGTVRVGVATEGASGMPDWLQSLLALYASGEAERSPGMDALIPDLIRDRVGLLLAQVGPAEDRRRSDRDHAVQRRTYEWLEGNPREPATVTSLSRELCIPPAELRGACLAVLGRRLDALLLARRLGNARRDIIAARDEPRRISDIALDWGFTHWGRFSTTYRDFFGEKPSETLRGAG